jgi:hypothetical protein
MAVSRSSAKDQKRRIFIDVLYFPAFYPEAATTEDTSRFGPL